MRELLERLGRRSANEPVSDCETAQLIEAFGAELGWPDVECQAEAKDPESQRFDKVEDRKQAILAASIEASRFLQYLRAHAAAGDEDAVSELAQLLVENANWLEGYSCRDKGNLKVIARRATAWPVVWAWRKQRAKVVADYLRRIELSAEAQISLSEKWGTTWGGEGNIATFYALGIRDLVGSVKDFVTANKDILPTNGPLSREAWDSLPQWARDSHRLGPLTKQSAPQWLEVGWQLILAKHGGQPEKDEELCKLGAHRADKYAHDYGTKDRAKDAKLLQRKKSPPRTAAADTRAGIKERILQALVSLAPSSL